MVEFLELDAMIKRRNYRKNPNTNFQEETLTDHCFNEEENAHK